MTLNNLFPLRHLLLSHSCPVRQVPNRCLSDESYGAMSYTAIAGKTAIRSTASIRSAYQSQST